MVKKVKLCYNMLCNQNKFKNSTNPNNFLSNKKFKKGIDDNEKI